MQTNNDNQNRHTVVGSTTTDTDTDQAMQTSNDNQNRHTVVGSTTTDTDTDRVITNGEVHVFNAEWDDEGVYFYQAYNNQIANWAIKHQTFANCPVFDQLRMTWLKPSFAWVLYRAGYGRKKNQERILKIKIGHDVLGRLLSQCVCGHGQGKTIGRIQWDPERDIMTAENGQPRKLLRRAIQIGFSRDLSQEYVKNILLIEDVTGLSHMVKDAHMVEGGKNREEAMQKLVSLLPFERPYVPHVDHEVLVRLAIAPGEPANEIS